MTDALAGLFNAAPRSAALPMSLRVGQLVSWDPATASGVVVCDGANLVNLPIIGDPDQLYAGAQIAIVTTGGQTRILGPIATGGSTPASAWRTIAAFSNGWTDRNASQAQYPPAAYRLADSHIEIVAYLKKGTLTNNTVIFHLPADATPSNSHIIPVGIDASAAPTLAATGLPVVVVRGLAAAPSAVPGDVIVDSLPTQTTMIHINARVPL